MLAYVGWFMDSVNFSILMQSASVSLKTGWIFDCDVKNVDDGDARRTIKYCDNSFGRRTTHRV